MQRLRNVCVASLLVWLGGCSSTPNNYHTLVPSEPVRDSGQRIQVVRVAVPPQVDRPQLVVRQGQSGLAILETEWWGANLVDEFRSALQDLLGGPAGGGKASLRVDVQRFDTVPGRYASLEAVWRLKQQGQAELTCRTSVQTAADNSITSLVNAHQANLRKLAEAVRGVPCRVAAGHEPALLLPGAGCFLCPFGLVLRQLIELAQAILAVRVADPAWCCHELWAHQALGRFIAVVAQSGQV